MSRWQLQWPYFSFFFHYRINKKIIQFWTDIEKVFAKRLIDTFKRDAVTVGLRPYDGTFSFQQLEAYLYSWFTIDNSFQSNQLDQKIIGFFFFNCTNRSITTGAAARLQRNTSSRSRSRRSISHLAIFFFCSASTRSPCGPTAPFTDASSRRMYAQDATLFSRHVRLHECTTCLLHRWRTLRRLQ